MIISLLISSCKNQKIRRIEIWDVPCLGNYEQHINPQNIRTISVATKTNIVDEGNLKMLSRIMRQSEFECVEVDEPAQIPDYRIVMLVYDGRNAIKDTLGVDFNNSIYRNHRIICTNDLLISYLQSILSHSDCFVR